jgi:hypothetical protein
VYQFDAAGFIRPTPEGIITPEGVLLRAGKPPRVPATRPQSVIDAAALAAPKVASDSTAALAPTDTAAAALPFPSDPALADKRPKLRPEGLAPAAAPADQGALPVQADTKLAGFRPKARPETVLAAGAQARQASAGASLAAQAEAAVPDASTSKMAVAISRKPAARPRDLSRAVEAAVAAASRQPDPQPEVQAEPQPEAQASAKPTKKTAPEADDEPELAAAPRGIPTKATVAKQATFKNAINLSKINLIGVYGTQSRRYALVRQANGRYKKVKVGDSIDGGRIAAITDSEVRYQKGGRLLALAMPRG